MENVTDEQDVDDQMALEGESKADKFKRVANFRLAKCVRRLRLMQNLANKASYEYTDAQVDLLIDALYDEVDDIARALRHTKKEVPQL